MSDSAPVRTVTQRLVYEPGAGAVARDLVLKLLGDHATTDELRHDAAMVVYELVANAVTHGRPDADGTIELHCDLVDDGLIVSVHDAGSRGFVAPRPLEPEAGNGRGLAIVDALSSSWTVDRADGTLVTAWLPLRWEK